MKRDRKTKRRIAILLVVAVAVVYFSPQLFAGYFWTETAASTQFYGGGQMDEVYEKEFGDKKIIISDRAQYRVAQLIDQEYGLLYKSSVISSIEGTTEDGNMKFTWAATHIENGQYDMLLAAETLNDEIQKVIVTNEYPENEEATLEELKEISDLYVEMDVVNGYAAHYLDLPLDEAGNLQFRGVDAEGDVVSIS